MLERPTVLVDGGSVPEPDGGGETGGPGLTDGPPRLALVVSADPPAFRAVELALSGEGFEVAQVVDLDDAERALAEADVACVLVDLGSTGGVPADSLTTVLALAGDTPVIALVDGNGGPAALAGGARDAVVKGPAKHEVLARAVRAAVERSDVTRALLRREAQLAALHEQARLARLTAEAAVAVSGGDTLAAVLDRCCQALVRELDTAWAGVWRTAEAPEGFLLAARSGESVAGADASVLPLTADEVRRVVGGRAPVVVSGPAGAGRGDPGWLVAAPLLVEDRLTGLLALSLRRPPAGPVLATVSAVATQVALGIDRKRAAEELAHQALHDPLTGLANRMLFKDRLEHALRRMGRRRTRVAVLFIDLDRFKLINDSFGHAAGDQVLEALARRLRQVLRPADTVGRFGGDEFTVLCEDLGADEDIFPIAQRALDALSAPVVLADGRQAFAAASIGVAVAGPAPVSAESLLGDADSAMYQAKDRGRNRIEIFDNAMRIQIAERAEESMAFRRALAGKELRVHYQPDVRLADESVAGVEALVRWQHPELGLVHPDRFIKLAEDTGLVVPLGAEVLRTACHEVARWQPTSGTALPTLAVNLSARQLVEPAVVDTVWEVLADTGMDPSRLCLEITESVLMDDVESSVEALIGLKRLGVRLAIDDFGTGYSSLTYLRRFPVDVVKIDRSFVAGLGVDPAAEAIVAAVVNLAHALGLVVVAEGVETEQQLTALRGLGCDRAQGYLWSRPRPAEEIRGWRSSRATSVLSTAVDVRAILVERTEAVRTATGRPFMLEIPAGLPAAHADAGAVRGVVDHLLANATTYSEAPRPVVVSASADRKWVRFSVADFGIGMTGAEVARCFEQFWQAESGAPFRRGGTGIGLSSARSLVELMGGRVTVKSAPGKGSTFTVSLPRSGRRAPQVGPSYPAPGVGEQSMVREFMRQIGVPNRREQ